MKCGKCGTENTEGLRFCVNCGTPLQVPQQTTDHDRVASTGESNLSVEAKPEDRDILNTRILAYVKVSYHLILRDGTSAQLVRQKIFSSVAGAITGLAMIGSILCAFLSVASALFALLAVLSGSFAAFVFVIGLLDYLGKRDESAFLYIDENGVLQEIVMRGTE